MTGDPRDGGQSVILDQAFDRDSLYQLRAAVSAHGAQAGLSAVRLGDLVLAVHELAANAVRHGAGHGRLLIWRNHQTLHCQVTDDGAAVNTSQWGTEPGHGLWLVRQIADQATWGSAAGGTTATVSFSLADQPSSAGAPSSARPSSGAP
jgi:anti-sigma regulatory factor (Ser/Thr protein kinase)